MSNTTVSRGRSRGELSVSSSQTCAQLVTREAGRAPHDAADPIGADDGLRAIDVGRGRDDHVVGVDVDRGDRTAIAYVEPAGTSCTCERVIELDPPHDDAAVGHARRDRAARECHRDCIEPHFRHVDVDADPLECLERARADAAGADLFARIALGFEQHRALGELWRDRVKMEQRR
jgi:hypothetical protein